MGTSDFRKSDNRRVACRLSVVMHSVFMVGFTRVMLFYQQCNTVTTYLPGEAV
jgi:cytochrome c oxidase assembly protein Cox11